MTQKKSTALLDRRELVKLQNTARQKCKNGQSKITVKQKYGNPEKWLIVDCHKQSKIEEGFWSATPKKTTDMDCDTWADNKGNQTNKC